MPKAKKKYKQPAAVQTKFKIQVAQIFIVVTAVVSFGSLALAFGVAMTPSLNKKPAQTVASLKNCRGLSSFKATLTCIAKTIQGKDQTPPEPVYNVALLPSLPGGGECEARDINQKNQVTGWCYASNGHIHAVMWENGQVKDLGLPKNQASFGTWANAINQSGNIVGHAQKLEEQTYLPMMLVNGAMNVFQPFSQDGLSDGMDINDQNSITGWGAYKIVDVGDIEDGTDEKKLIEHAFLRKAENIVDLGASDDFATSHANSMNNRDQIVGKSEFKFGEKYANRAVLWQGDPSTMTLLDSRTAPLAESEAYSINELEKPQIVGRMLVDVGGPYVAHGFLWENDQIIDLGTDSCNFSFSSDINNTGGIVGYAYGYPCSDDVKEYKALLWTLNGNERMAVDLNKLIADTRWHLTIPYALTDSFSIVGKGIYQGRQSAFLLTPVQ